MLTPLEAEKIIFEDFNSLIANPDPRDAVFLNKLSLLPCGKSMVRYAFFVYIEKNILESCWIRS